VNGALNDKLIVQEFLKGIEYIVDCVSFEGRHVLVGIFEYLPAGTWTEMRDGNILLPSRGRVQDILVPYVFECLTALGIRYGASHSEAIVVDGEPCLVEVGARMHGRKGAV